MCGRYNLHADPAQVAEAFDLQRVFDFEPWYNVAPTQDVLVVRGDADGRAASAMRWGLVPSWAKDVSFGSRLVNARAETVAEKPSFRAAFRQRRCLVPATGFYEWQATGAKHKQPFHVRMQDGGVFAFAGLWECWHPPDGSGPVESCTIVTTEPNAVCRKVHDRMPVILHPADYDAWCAAGEADDLLTLLLPYPAEAMEAYPVSRYVGNARHEGPRCVEPLEPG